MPDQNGRGRGAKGNCICLKCNYKIPKNRGVPCMQMKCPLCGAVLLREGGQHYQRFMAKKK